MKNLFFFLFISSVFFMSCSEDDIINNDIIDIIDDGGENKVDGESSSNITTSVSIFGQWIFNSYSGGGGGNEYGYGGGGEQICNVHSIIFSEDFTFNLYTDNFVLFGDYIIDTLDIIYDTTNISYDTTVVISSNDTTTTIDTIYEIYIEYEKYLSLYIENEKIGGIDNPAVNDTTGALTGEFQFDDFCIEVEEAYYDSVWNANRVYVPDSIFEAYLIEKGYDDQHDNYVWKINVKDITWIGDMGSTDDDICQISDCTDEQWEDMDYRFKNRIKNLSGIEALVNIQGINIIGHKIDSINLSKNINLTHFYANFNEFKSVNTEYNSKLLVLSIDGNKPDWSEDIENGIIEPWDTITRLDFSKNLDIESISVPSLGLTRLKLENNVKINFLDLYNNNFTNIDLSNQTELQELRIQFNKLKSIDLTNNIKLEILMLLMNDLEGNLDVSTLNNLIELHLVGNENLSCIQVNQQQLDKLNAGELQGWENPHDTPYSLNCN